MKTKKISIFCGFLLLLFLIIGFKQDEVLGVGEEAVAVSTPAEFRNAWNNQQIRKIELKSDITIGSVSPALTRRVDDIEVSGSKGSTEFGDFYKLTLTSLTGANSYLGLGMPKDKQIKKMLFHDIEMENNGDLLAGQSAAIIADSSYDKGNSDTEGQFWELTFGNLIVPSGRTARLARTTRGQVNLYGKIDLTTRGENFYAGGVDVADGTDYYGKLTNANYSVIWFRNSIREGDTGSGDFIVGQNAKVKLRNLGTGVTFPAIYRNWQTIIIGENSEFTATVPGSAIQFGGVGKKFVAKEGSTVTLTSKNSYSSISTDSVTGGDSLGINTADKKPSGENSEFIMEPGSSLYVIGKAEYKLGLAGSTANKEAMIDWRKGKNNKFLIDTPKQFDIRNNSEYDVKTNERNTSHNPAVILSAENTFTIKNSNLDMWEKTTPLTEVSDFSYNQVPSMSYVSKGSNHILNIMSQDEELQKSADNYVLNTKDGYLRRISGLNTNPVVEWQRYPTDAEKTFNKIARVRTGIFPDDNGLTEAGDLTFVKLYARKNQASVTIADSNNSYSTEIVNTDGQGYISLKGNPLREKPYPVGTIISGQARRGGLLGDVQELPPVVDVTPPNPVKLTTKLTTSTKVLKGTAEEPNSSIYLQINKESLTKVGQVEADNTWQITLPKFLNATDTVTLYLEDDSGKLPVEIEDYYLAQQEPDGKFSLPLGFLIPVTNNIRGNINSNVDVSFIDTLFLKASAFTVRDDLAKKISIQKRVKSSTVDENKNEWTEVGSRLTYTVNMKNDEVAGGGKLIKNARFSDDILTSKRRSRGEFSTRV